MSKKSLKSDYVDKEGTLVTLNVSERKCQSMSDHRAGLVFRILFLIRPNDSCQQFRIVYPPGWSITGTTYRIRKV
jgi:hypothetical protein